MAENATGLTITMDTGFMAEILSVTGPGGERISIPTSHMGTTVAHTFIPGDLVDWGEVQVELAFVPKTRPPIDDPAETISLNFPDSTASVWSFSGFLTNFEPTGELEARMTATCTIKVSGDVTIT